MFALRVFFLLSLFLATQAARGQSFPSDYVSAVDLLSLDDLRGAMMSVSDHGLNVKSYWTDSMEASYQQWGPGNPLLKSKANENYLELLRDLSSGVVDPAAVGSDVKLQRKPFVTSKYLRALIIANGLKARALLDSFAPQTAPYLALKESLGRIKKYCDPVGWPSLPSFKKPLKLGDKNPALVSIKNRMRLYGYSIPNVDEVFDLPTLNAITDIQWMLRFKPDGILSPNGKTFKYLNVSCEERMRTLRLDMEKLRWFPQNFEDRYIFINLAMSYFSLVDKTKNPMATMSFRTINGRPTRKSPMMKDKIVQIIVNPFWVVPPTIFKEDKIEEIRNLLPWEITTYFESRNYEVWNRSFTRKIDPASIDWWALDPSADAEIYIRQRPNYMNALGVLKFSLTNSYAIYLHDTNQRELFAEPLRLLSSGCIRLERPVDLAEYLLQGTSWTREALEKVMAKPGEVLENETRINLKNPIPVYLAFLTSQLSSDGVLRFAEDSYNQNKRLLLRGAW